MAETHAEKATRLINTAKKAGVFNNPALLQRLGLGDGSASTLARLSPTDLQAIESALGGRVT